MRHFCAGKGTLTDVCHSYNVQIRSEVGINPQHHRITLYQKPEGVDGPWVVWNELITLTTAQPWIHPMNGMDMPVPMLPETIVDVDVTQLPGM